MVANHHPSVCRVWSIITPQSGVDGRELSGIRAAKRITSTLCGTFFFVPDGLRFYTLVARLKRPILLNPFSYDRLPVQQTNPHAMAKHA